ncbi:unnamed protein product [Mytilus edulis]|uniref:Uncharacterized protein n=1 Tax=Mytilus edulis TaxID=6550 RepID=A0A8S3UJT9_MYTED|nr:unnamed protein product [Mytilus edulis]
MAEYEDCEVKYEDCEVKYDTITETVLTKSNITKETFSSRKLWIKIVILVMTVSLVCSVLGVTITYLVMRGELCCKKTPSNSSATVDQQISIMSKKLDMIQMKSEKLTQQAKQVAFTACLSADATVQRGHNIQFGDIKTSYRVGSLTELKSSGRFTTRDYGLYQVIAIVKSQNRCSGLYSQQK